MIAKDCIRARRSVRAFSDKDVEEGLLRDIVRAALYAPVGMKMYDSLHLSVLPCHAEVEKFTQLCRSQSGDENADPVHNAAALIVVSGKRTNAVEYANSASMIENMLLAATDLRLGNLYVFGAVNATHGTPYEKKLAQLLQLPEGFTPLGSVAVGYCDAEFLPREQPNRVTGVNFVK